MTDSVKCECGRRVPIMSNPTFVSGPLTPTEELLERAKAWAYGSFAHAEPFAANIMRELIAALEGKSMWESALIPESVKLSLPPVNGEPHSNDRI